MSDERKDIGEKWPANTMLTLEEKNEMISQSGAPKQNNAREKETKEGTSKPKEFVYISSNMTLAGWQQKHEEEEDEEEERISLIQQSWKGFP